MTQRVLRVEGLPASALDAAAQFHARDLPAARAVLRDAERGRSTLARSRASEEHAAARRSARRADEHSRDRLVDGLTGQCAAIAPSQS